MDMTREIPYEMLNTLQVGATLSPPAAPGHAWLTPYPAQNDGVKHGQNVYMRGVAQSGSPAADFTTAAAACAAELTASGEFRLGLLFEYFPLRRVNAAAPGATAFPRPAPGNILTMVFWDGAPDEDRARRARAAAHELARVLGAGKDAVDSYGNYSECSACAAGGGC